MITEDELEQFIDYHLQTREGACWSEGRRQFSTPFLEVNNEDNNRCTNTGAER